MLELASERPNTRRALRFGLVVALIALPLELARLQMATELGLVTAAIFGALGVTTGLVIELEIWLAARLSREASAKSRASRWLRAVVYALGSLLCTVPLARNLFSGSFAATLPGAAWAHLWVPLFATLALALGLFVFQVVRTKWRGRFGSERGLGLSVATLALAVDLLNRNVRSSEYPDIHAFGVVVVFTANYLALLMIFSGPKTKLPDAIPAPQKDVADSRPRGAWWRSASTWAYLLAWGSGAFAITVSAAFGLADRDDRLLLTQHGQHSRWLVRVLRAGLDFDGDGSASAFGGPDCDDLDAAIGPHAPERFDNSVDEDCDGLANRSTAPGSVEQGSAPRHLDLEGIADARRALAYWSDSVQVQALREALDSPNLVLISIDALRADVLRDTPENRAQFKNLFDLLDGSRRFEHAFAPAAGTDLSMSTLMTGHVDAFASTPATLAEHLQQAGWYTTSVVPSEVLRYAGRTLLKRGFERTSRLVNDAQEQDVGLYSSSARTTKIALADVDRYLELSQAAIASGERPRPLALWVHYFDVHEHHELSPFDKQLRKRTRSRDPVERYRASLELVDEGVGALRAGLEERGLWERSVVVLLSDHGESLHEDPRLPDNHGRVLYSALSDVPLAIHVPGWPAGSSSMPASLLDVVPTLLSILGIETRTTLDGLDLMPELVPDHVSPPAGWRSLERRALAMFESDQRGVVSWPYKLLWRPAERIYELYDLAADPLEQADLSESHADLRAELVWLLSQQARVELDRTTAGRRAREKAAAASGSVGGP